VFPPCFVHGRFTQFVAISLRRSQVERQLLRRPIGHAPSHLGTHRSPRREPGRRASRWASPPFHTALVPRWFGPRPIGGLTFADGGYLKSRRSAPAAFRLEVGKSCSVFNGRSDISQLFWAIKIITEFIFVRMEIATPRGHASMKGAAADLDHRGSYVPSPATFQSNRPPNSRRLSILGLPRRSASPCRQRCSRAPTR
jgi:hypothetical protein